MTLSRHTRRRLRRIEVIEGISQAELAEIGLTLLAVMPVYGRLCWRQLARQCDRETQLDAAYRIGQIATEAWIEEYASRKSR